MGKQWCLCGIYKIQYPDGSFYIGSSSNVRKRIFLHMRPLFAGLHKSLRLQRNWSKFRKVTISTVLVCRESDLLLYEQIMLDNLQPTLNGCLVAQRRIWTDESRAKMSIVHLGRKRPPSTSKKISDGKKGNGIGNQNRTGKPDPEQEKLRKSLTMFGNTLRKGVLLSEDHKGKIASSLKGNERRKGKVRSPEERAKVSATLKMRWAEKKAANVLWRPKNVIA